MGTVQPICFPPTNLSTVSFMLLSHLFFVVAGRLGHNFFLKEGGLFPYTKIVTNTVADALILFTWHTCYRWATVLRTRKTNVDMISENCGQCSNCLGLRFLRSLPPLMSV